MTLMKRKFEGPLLVAPAALIIIMIMVVPLFYTLHSSVSSIDYLQFKGFVGLDNYRRVLTDPVVWSSFRVTLIMTAAAAFLSLVTGTVLAVWVDKLDKRKSRLAYVVEIVGLIPWVTSMVVAALLWKWVLDGDMGLYNYFRNCIGLDNTYVFLGKQSAILTTLLIIAWRTVGYSMVMILAGLKGLPDDVIEAAQADGAGAGCIFFRIKLPMIKTPALISSVVLIMSNFNNLTIPLVMTGGGPGTATNVISLVMYKTGFLYFQFGPASALSMLMFAVNFAFVALYVKAVGYKL